MLVADNNTVLIDTNNDKNIPNPIPGNISGNSNNNDITNHETLQDNHSQKPVPNHSNAARTSARHDVLATPAATFDLQGYQVFTQCKHPNLKRDLFKLRYDVYYRELGWVECDTDQEIDKYDDYSSHLAVQTPEGQVVGTIRFTHSRYDWMIEDCFPFTVDGDLQSIRQPGYYEASRLAIDPAYRNARFENGFTVMDMLLAGVLYQCQQQGMETLVIVTTKQMAAILKRRRWHLQALGELVTMPDCVIGGWSIDIAASKHKDPTYNAILDDNLQALEFAEDQTINLEEEYLTA